MFYGMFYGTAYDYNSFLKYIFVCDCSNSINYVYICKAWFTIIYDAGAYLVPVATVTQESNVVYF